VFDQGGVVRNELGFVAINPDFSDVGSKLINAPQRTPQLEIVISRMSKNVNRIHFSEG
jgi:hypothetical protein